MRVIAASHTDAAGAFSGTVTIYQRLYPLFVVSKPLLVGQQRLLTASAWSSTAAPAICAEFRATHPIIGVPVSIEVVAEDIQPLEHRGHRRLSPL